MKKRILLGIMCVLLVGSLAACGNGKNRYGEDADYSDVTIYETKWAEEEIATWENHPWAEGSSDKGKIFIDDFEFQIDGHNAKFPACASKVVENPTETDFDDRIFGSGGDRRSVEVSTENCRVLLTVDNNSGKELYQGEMACYRVEIEPRNDEFSMNILGVEINEDTKADDVIAVLGDPYYTDDSKDIQYQFNKGTIEFCFDKEYENGDFEYAMIYAVGANRNY